MGEQTWRGPDIAWPSETTLPQLAAKVAQEEPDAVALIEGVSGRVTTRRDLRERTFRFARGLAARGFRRGDCICTIMPNCVEWYVAALAAQSLGGTISGINPGSTAEEILRQISRVPATAIVTTPALLDLARRATQGIGTDLIVAGDAAVRTASLDDLDGLELADDEPRTSPNDLALLPFSSGTTGLPKAVAVAHGNLLAGGAQIAHGLGIGRGDRILGLAPLFHIVGPSLFAASLVSRAAIVVVSGLEPELLFDIIESKTVTHMPIVPPVLRALATDPAGRTRNYSGLRAVACGGAAVHPSIQQAAIERFGCPVVQVYGMTETAGIIAMDDRARPLSDGGVFPSPLCEVRIVDPASDLPLHAEQDGEIQIRGPQIAQGYLGLPTETAQTITRDGWLRSGDIGRFDRNGRLFITGRLKELIKVHSSQVAPAELEAVVATHPAVSDVAVIGRPNSHCGEIPVAYVVWRYDADPSAVMEWANEQMISYKRIRSIETTLAIPRNAIGKVDRKALALEDADRTRRGPVVRDASAADRPTAAGDSAAMAGSVEQPM